MSGIQYRSKGRYCIVCSQCPGFSPGRALYRVPLPDKRRMPFVSRLFVRDYTRNKYFIKGSRLRYPAYEYKPFDRYCIVCSQYPSFSPGRALYRVPSGQSTMPFVSRLFVRDYTRNKYFLYLSSTSFAFAKSHPRTNTVLYIQNIFSVVL